jgi:hypothetical protein
MYAELTLFYLSAKAPMHPVDLEGIKARTTVLRKVCGLAIISVPKYWSAMFATSGQELQIELEKPHISFPIGRVPKFPGARQIGHLTPFGHFSGFHEIDT